MPVIADKTSDTIKQEFCIAPWRDVWTSHESHTVLFEIDEETDSRLADMAQLSDDC